MFLSTYLGILFGACAVTGGLTYYIVNRGTFGVKVDLDNIKKELEHLKSIVMPVPVVTPAPVVTPVVPTV